MKPILMMGTLIVHLALVFYIISYVKQKKSKIVSYSVLRFQLIGVTFDVLATILMILGSSNSPFSLHGILGYSSLTGMIIDTYLLFNSKHKNGENSEISRNLSLYSTIAFVWWIAAYITGALLVVLKRIGS